MKKTVARKEKNVVLVDLLDRLLEKGAVVQGDVAIRLADIDLVYIGLRLMVTSISKAASLEGAGNKRELNQKLTKQDKEYLDALDRQIKKTEQAIPKVINGKDAKEIEKGLATLVLTVVELLRRLMEREALRQVKLKQVSAPETQKLGMALKSLSVKMEHLKAVFGLDDDDLNLDLGPLGELM
jgi:hypothetical protein